MEASITYTMLSGCWGQTGRKEEKRSQQGAEPDLPEVHCGAFRDTHHSVGNLQHLLEQRVLLLVTTAGVHDDDLKVLRLELLHAFGRDHHGVHLCVAAHRTQVITQLPRRRRSPTGGANCTPGCDSPAIEGNSGLGGVLFQLVEGT